MNSKLKVMQGLSNINKSRFKIYIYVSKAAIGIRTKQGVQLYKQPV